MRSSSSSRICSVVNPANCSAKISTSVSVGVGVGSGRIGEVISTVSGISKGIIKPGSREKI